MKNRLSILIIILSALIVSYSCDSGNNDNAGGGSTNVQGKVVDEFNVPIAGATVSSGTSSGITNASGEYTLPNVSVSDRNSIKLVALGYFEAIRGFIAAENRTSYVNVMMISKGSATNFNSSAGATLTNQGGTVTIGANTLMDANGTTYNGAVKGYLKFQNPSQANFEQLMQGGDFMGVNAAEQTGVLSSYGFYSISLEDAAGSELNIKTGNTATFKMPIVANQSAMAPTTVKLWSFDKTTSMWKEEGIATKNGSNYIGSVAHFSEWNCDDWNTLGTIKGKIACDGTTFSNVLVTIINGTNMLYTNTNSNGDFSINIPSGFDVLVHVEGISDIPVTALATAEVRDLGTLQVCPTQPGTGSYTVGSTNYSNMPTGCGVDLDNNYYVLAGSGGLNDHLVVLFGGPTMPLAGTYPIVSAENYFSLNFIVPIGSACFECYGNNLLWYPIGSGNVTVTYINEKLNVTFSNISVGNSTPGIPATLFTTVSGNIGCP